MELIVHAGYPKSATSTIQAKLYANRDTLLRHGILYPAAGMFEKERAHHMLGWAIAGQKAPSGKPLPRAAEILQTVFDEAQANAAQRVIISSESLAAVLRDTPSKLTALLQNGPFNSVRLELVARRADEYLESFFFHSLRAWAQGRHRTAIPHVKQAQQNMLANPCGHLRIAQNALASGIPSRLRVYDRNGQAVETLLSDMLGQAATPLLDQTDRNTKSGQNLRSNSRFLALVYLLSQSDEADRLQHQLAPHIRQLQKVFNDGQPCGLLQQEQRQRIMQAAKPLYQSLPGLQSLGQNITAAEPSSLHDFESQWTFSAAQTALARELFKLDLPCLAEEYIRALQ